MIPSSKVLQTLKTEFSAFIDLIDKEKDNTPDLFPMSLMEKIMSLTYLISENRSESIKRINQHLEDLIYTDFYELKRKINSINQPSYIKKALLSALEEEEFTQRQLEIIINIINLKSPKEKEHNEYEDMEKMLDYMTAVRELRDRNSS